MRNVQGVEEGEDGMTRDECANLLDAYEQIVMLAESDTIRKCDDIAAYADEAKDSLGEFIASLLYEVMA